MGETAERYGKPHGLTRSTTLTMMERLRKKKGYLTRAQEAGMFRYRLTLEREELQRGLVGEFMQRAFGGSFEPFMAYLLKDAELNDAEIDKLETLVRELASKRKGEDDDPR